MAIVDETIIGEFFVLFTFGRLKAATISRLGGEGFDVDEITVVVAGDDDSAAMVTVVVVVVVTAAS